MKKSYIISEYVQSFDYNIFITLVCAYSYKIFVKLLVYTFLENSHSVNMTILVTLSSIIKEGFSCRLPFLSR